MTPAEKMAQELEDRHPRHDEVRTVNNELVGLCTSDAWKAAALIRRLAAAFAYALDNMPMDQYLQLKQRHADALRDIREGEG